MFFARFLPQSISTNVNAHLTDCISHECYASDSSRTTEERKYSNLFDPVSLEATDYNIYIFVFAFLRNCVSRQ